VYCLIAYPLAWRVVAALLVAAGGTSLVLILLAVLVATDPPVTPPVLFEWVTLGALVPATAAWLIRRACAAEIAVDGGALVMRRSRLRVEVPVTAIARIVPWTIPLPAPGLWLRLRSGRRLRYGFAGRDLTSLVSALAEAGVDAADAAENHPTVVFAATRATHGSRQWLRHLVKFPLFGLLPTAILFNAHQYIAYGGTWGEYYLLGPLSYARTFAVYWLTVTIYLVLYAALWRGAAEAAVLASAWLAPARADQMRRLAEWAARIGYYGGVPVLLALRFTG
jgi:hypothetical protein